MKGRLNSLQIVGIDTNIFVYYFNRHSPFFTQAWQLFKTIASKRIQIVASVLTLTELFSFKARRQALEKLESELLLIPNLSIIDVNRDIAKEAARIRREYNFRLPDSIQLSTALNQKAQAFISNDQKLKQFKELKIILLNQI